MKKLATFIGALLVFAGVKAQTTTPSVKKETVKPGTMQSGLKGDSMNMKTIKGGSNKAIKDAQSNSKYIKGDSAQIKDVKSLKDTPAQKITPAQKLTPAQKIAPMKEKPIKK